MQKPFRPLTFKHPPTPSIHSVPSTEPPAKRQRLSGDDEPVKRTTTQLVFKNPGISSLPRKPLQIVDNPAIDNRTIEERERDPDEAYYNVLWRKFSAKKHKTWDGDGMLRVTGGYAYLQDVSGKEMGRAACSTLLSPESTLSVGGKDVEVESVLSRDEYLASRPSARLSTSTPPATSHANKPAAKFQPPIIALEVAKEKEETPKAPSVTPSISKASQARFKNPMQATTVVESRDISQPCPRHDPNAPGAIVMKRPKLVPKGKQVVDIVVDPILTKHLREHQREGVKFLYECVMGLRDFDGEGAILADAMGLGKTLQTIALLWTLLKQNPIYGESPVVKKAVIVCPVTLINNWKKEFRKWLGNERIGVFVADDAKYKRIADFTKGKSYNVMIIGYEKLRTVQEDLKKGAGIDIVIADEGHRLKTAKNKSAEAIKSLNTSKRIILSGTPLQNDLSEVFSVVDFVNPGILGNFKSFTKEFDVPINRGRQPGASENDREKGDARSEELASLTNMFILRRSADILAKYLPPRTEYILMCRPTTTQASVYNQILASSYFQSALGTPELYLQLITLLKKVCNSPKLLSREASQEGEKEGNTMTRELVAGIPPALLRHHSASAKLRVLDQLLHTLRTTTNEKVVLVSNFTSTLDLLQELLASHGMHYLRLDGTTPASKRQDLVDSFNRSPAKDLFAFLLSAKAGGQGLNLIGASRLVLFDVDWNPAVDVQAMARIHRDGQKRPCVIYRLLLAGGLDEKIWQRQVTKLGLASSVMDQKGGISSFTREELKDLFRLDGSAGCQTHELIGCTCQGMGLPDSAAEAGDALAGEEDEQLLDIPTLLQASKVDMAEQERRIRERARAARAKQDSSNIQGLMSYSHIDTSKFGAEQTEDMDVLIPDDVLLHLLKEEQQDGVNVSFVFAKTSA